MSLRSRVLAILILLNFAMTVQAVPTIVNVNARTNSGSNPVIVSLAAGTYDVVPIGVADGGAYDAWNPWGFVSHPGSGTGYGWIHAYSIDSDQFPLTSFYSGVRYAIPTEALADATSTSFTLATAGDVLFYVGDTYYGDNIGGVSLLVGEPGPAIPPCAVPVPGALVLVAVGAALVGHPCCRRYL